MSGKFMSKCLGYSLRVLGYVQDGNKSKALDSFFFGIYSKWLFFEGLFL